MDIQTPGVVIGIKPIVALLEAMGVDPAQLQRELAPALVGIEWQQGLV